MDFFIEAEMCKGPLNEGRDFLVLRLIDLSQEREISVEKNNQANKNKLSLVIGLTGSGKSTFAETLEGKHIHIDEIRKSLTGTYATEGNENQLVTDVAKRTVYHYLQQGARVIVDASLLSAKHRKEYIKIAEKVGVPVEVFWIDTEFETNVARLLERNKAVPADRRIDLQYLYKQTGYFDMPVCEEGIDTIIRISED